jgi:hypothetical protein
MALKLYGKDPNCPGNNCPAVFRDEETGDLYFQGETVVDPALLAKLSEDCGISDSESVVKLPARMAEMIVEACRAGAVV